MREVVSYTGSCRSGNEAQNRRQERIHLQTKKCKQKRKGEQRENRGKERHPVKKVHPCQQESGIPEGWKSSQTPGVIPRVPSGDTKANAYTFVICTGKRGALKRRVLMLEFNLRGRCIRATTSHLAPSSGRNESQAGNIRSDLIQYQCVMRIKGLIDSQQQTTREKKPHFDGRCISSIQRRD
ncbi:hypothetical protein EI555_012065 [Monodon monoceros]|uniref:Uncharacterized protein n=1 Tax=Monodon monoceros TaxID=40151 RepID=A0A4V6WPA0_MONMO|nr:hypothetical protein EI555_012065 [Monodon monoceros]